MRSKGKIMKKLFLFLFLSQLCYGLIYSEVNQLVILGGGPSGLTAAIFSGQAHLNPLVIEGEVEEGQYGSVFHIENFPGFLEGISGQELNEKLAIQAKKFGAQFHSGKAVKVDLFSRPFHIDLSDGTELEAESLIIATGAAPKWLGVEGEKELIGKGISANAMRDAANHIDQSVLVIGGGDAAMEQALILAEYASDVTISYRGSTLFASKYLQERVLNHPKIHCLLETEVLSIQGADQQKVTGASLIHKSTREHFDLPFDGIFVAIGRQPNTHLFKEQLELTNTGYVVTTPDSTKTTIPGVFAAGDITEKAYRKMVTSAASGCMAALDAIRFLKE